MFDRARAQHQPDIEPSHDQMRQGELHFLVDEFECDTGIGVGQRGMVMAFASLASLIESHNSAPSARWGVRLLCHPLRGSPVPRTYGERLWTS